ncbi:MAG: thymidine phosphorylase [Candidatus Sumerlaeota bacterium]|nr:thymidine phosphorylase [Candidatus Sumerlaeota bacterium]
MPFLETILRKRAGKALSTEEIAAAVGDYVAGRAPEYQMAALLMAAYFRGLTSRETRDLTRAMIRSGEVYDLRALPGRKVDKHSTGGVGDKISIPLAPLVASAGGIVPMVSGRGLGHTGGTLDKLESIPGFRVRLSPSQFRRQLERIGVFMAGQSERLVPADRKLYALRDVTGTVESIPLIAASILSKKVAAGNDGLVMDVKVGSGAFMPTAARSRELARTLVALGRRLGLRTVAYLTDMNQPLGRAIGNALEIRESIEILQGGGPPDVRELTLELGARMLLLGGKAKTMKAGRELLRTRVAGGQAFEKFLELVAAQGGNAKSVETPAALPAAPVRLEVGAERAGHLARIDTRAVGMAAVFLGAGRQKIDDAVDPGVGFVMLRKLGERVETGELIWRIHARSRLAAEAAAARLRAATHATEAPVRPPELIRGLVE